MNQVWLNFASVDWSQLPSVLMMTLAHFLWQASLIGLLVFSLLRYLKTNSANTRYLVAFVGFTCLPIVCLVTFSLQLSSDQNGTSPQRAVFASEFAPNTLEISQPFEADHFGKELRKYNSAETGSANLSHTDTVADTPSSDATLPKFESNLHITSSKNSEESGTISNNTSALSTNRSVDATSGKHTTATWITIVYLIGAATMLGRLMVLVGIGQCRRVGNMKFDSILSSVVRQLSHRVGIQSVPRASFSESILVPAVVGIIKPIILIPTSAATGLTKHELESILLHELAHIRRFDVLANLFQKLIEAILFFHPVVWWISRQVNTERENCCDDIAAYAGSGRLSYAAALLRMAEICCGNLKKRNADIVAVSADGNRPSQLTRRIQRLMNIADQPRMKPSGLISFILIAVIGFSALLSAVIGQEKSILPVDPSHTNPTLKISAEEITPAAKTQHPNRSTKSKATVQRQQTKPSVKIPDANATPKQDEVAQQAIAIVEAKIEYKLGGGSWQSGAHRASVQMNLANLEPREKVIATLLESIRKPGITSTEGRRHALRFLAFKAPKRLVLILKNYLETHSDLANFKVLPLSETAALGTIGSAAGESIPVLVKLLSQSKSLEFKRAIIYALVKIDPSSNVVIDAIASQLDNSNQYFRANVVYELGRFEKDAAKFKQNFVGLLDDQYQNVRIWAAQALIKTEAEPQTGFKFLFDSLKTGNRTEKKLAATALAALGNRADKAIDRLAQLRKSEKDNGVLAQIDEAIDRIKKDDRIFSHAATFLKNKNSREDSKRALEKLRSKPTKDDSEEKLDEPIQHAATKDSRGKILWGETKRGLRLGIRQADNQKTMEYRHGDVFAYEFWIRNDSKNDVHFLNDTWKIPKPALWKEKRINPIGTSYYLRLGGLERKLVTIKPGNEVNFLTWPTIAFVRPADPRIEHTGSSLRLSPDRYLVKAERDFSYYQSGDPDLKRKDISSIRLASGAETIRIKPAGKIQFRKWTKNKPELNYTFDKNWRTLLDEDGIESAKKVRDMKTDSWSVEIRLNELGKNVYGWEADRLRKVGIHGQAIYIDGQAVSDPFPFSENLHRFTIKSLLTKSEASKLAETINNILSLATKPPIKKSPNGTQAPNKVDVPNKRMADPTTKTKSSIGVQPKNETKESRPNTTNSKEPDTKRQNQKINKVQWGERKNGLRMGVRYVSKGKPGPHRPGDRVFYKVLIANESKDAIYVRLDPNIFHREKKDDRSVNVIGSSIFMSFSVPESAFANAMIALKPNETKVVWNTQFLVCEPGTKPGKYFHDPFCSANETLDVFAETNVSYLVEGISDHRRRDGKSVSLKSGKETLVVAGVPKFQVGRAATNSGRNPSLHPTVDRILNENGLERAAVVQVGKSYEIEFTLTPEGAKFFNWSVGTMRNLKPTPDLIFQIDQQVITTEKMRTVDANVYLTNAKLSQNEAEAIVQKINSAIPARKADLPKTASQQIEANKDGAKVGASLGNSEQPNSPSKLDNIHWAPDAVDGIRSGAKILQNPKKHRAGSPLVIQYYLKNEAESEKTVSLVGSKSSFPFLQSENRIDLSYFPTNQNAKETKLKPGEVLVSKSYQTILDTTGFPSGKYQIKAHSYFHLPSQKDPTTMSGLRVNHSLPVVIDNEETLNIRTLPVSKEQFGGIQAKEIAWGKHIGGIEFGIALAGEYSQFKIGESPIAQLFARNVTDKKIKFQVQLPHYNDGWWLGLTNSKNESINLVRTRISLISLQQPFEMQLDSGGIKAVSGVKQGGKDSGRQIENATFQIKSQAPEQPQIWNNGILISTGGKYRLNCTVRVQRDDLPGLQIHHATGSIPLVVLTPRHRTETAVQPNSATRSATDDFGSVDLRDENANVASIEKLSGESIDTLTISSDKITPEMMAKLDRVKSIRSLRLFGDGISGSIPRLQKATGLTSLYLDCPLVVSDLAALGQLKQLQHLQLPQKLALTVSGARHLSNLTSLTSLSFYNADVDDASIHELAPLTKLETLDLSLTCISDEGLKTVLKMPNLKVLRLMRYSFGPQLSDKSVETITSLKNLKSVSLSGEISDDGFKLICEMPSLEKVSITNASISCHGLKHLIGSKIKHLIANPQQIDSQGTGVSHLKNCKSLKSIHVIGEPRSNFDSIQSQLPEIDWMFSS